MRCSPRASDLHGAEHQVTLITSGNLALALSRNDELKPAEHIQRELLCVRMRLFGPLHTSTLTVQGNLATTLMRRGKLEESEGMERLVHRGRTETLGPESSVTLVSAGNLALVLSMRGKGSEAAKLMLATWRVQKRVLGRAHPDTGDDCRLVKPAWETWNRGEETAKACLLGQLGAPALGAMGDSPVIKGAPEVPYAGAPFRSFGTFKTPGNSEKGPLFKNVV